MFTHVTIREYNYLYSSVFHFFEIAIFIAKYTKQKSTCTPFLARQVLLKSSTSRGVSSHNAPRCLQAYGAPCAR